MFLRIVSYTLIVTLTTSLIAPPVWASAAIMRHYAGRMDDYNTDYKRASIGEATTEINRIFERAPSKKKANAEQKEQIFRTAMQTSTIHGTNAFLHGQTQTDANYYLSEKVQASNHHRILYGISALSYTYADILRSVSDEDLINILMLNLKHQKMHLNRSSPQEKDARVLMDTQKSPASVDHDLTIGLLMNS